MKSVWDGFDTRKWAINRRVEILERMGFVIVHQDSCVTRDGYVFDFSAIHPDETSIMYHTIKTVEQEARRKGRNELRAEHRAMMQFEGDDE